MRLSILAVLGAVTTALLSGCADEPSTRGAATESSYVTGSNIPRRDSRVQNGVQTGTIDNTNRVPQGQTRTQ